MPTCATAQLPSFLGDAAVPAAAERVAESFPISPPSLQTFPSDHLGRIYFSLTFDYATESLSVLIKKIKNLPRSTKEGGITNKTYVK